jgi:predicted secreted protein
MGLSYAIAIYFVIWWLSLFVVLPFGVRTQAEAGEQVPGTPASAPHRMPIARVLIATTVIASLVFGLFYWLRTSQVIRLDDIPILRP